MQRVNELFDVVVAGHICLDIFPELKGKTEVKPGKLIESGAVSFHIGGAVANTGIALNKLGIRSQLIGKVGNDYLADILLNQLELEGFKKTQKIQKDPEGHTSYTIVLSQPGIDRTFFHCAGVNDTFSTLDIDDSSIKNAKIFHFGYPPLMRKMFENDGEELVRLFRSIKEKGLAVSLDMAHPDPDSKSGKVSWKSILQNCLPFVDIFMPSIEETIYMLDLPLYNRLQACEQDFVHNIGGTLLTEISDELIRMGAAIVGLKLGENGLYIRTTHDQERLKSIGLGLEDENRSWLGRELWIPCFEVNTVGTTGAGDCTIAGFLSGIIKSLSVEDTMQMAVGVGAYNVEGNDATSTIPDFKEVQQRIKNNWKKKQSTLDLSDWSSLTSTNTLWSGPKDNHRHGRLFKC